MRALPVYPPVIGRSHFKQARVWQACIPCTGKLSGPQEGGVSQKIGKGECDCNYTTGKCEGSDTCPWDIRFCTQNLWSPTGKHNSASVHWSTDYSNWNQSLLVLLPEPNWMKRRCLWVTAWMLFLKNINKYVWSIIFLKKPHLMLDMRQIALLFCVFHYVL